MVVTPDNRTGYILGGRPGYGRSTRPRHPRCGHPGPGAVARPAITPDGGTLLASAGSDAVTPIATTTEPARHADRRERADRPRDRPGRPDGIRAHRGQHPHADRSDHERPRTPIALAHARRAVEITPDGTLAVVSETEARCRLCPGDRSRERDARAAGVDVRAAGGRCRDRGGWEHRVRGRRISGLHQRPVRPATIDGGSTPSRSRRACPGAQVRRRQSRLRHRPNSRSPAPPGDLFGVVSQCHAPQVRVPVRVPRAPVGSGSQEHSCSVPATPTKMRTTRRRWCSPRARRPRSPSRPGRRTGRPPSTPVASNNDGGSITNYAWDFGDGPDRQHGARPAPSHTFTAPWDLHGEAHDHERGWLREPPSSTPARAQHATDHRPRPRSRTVTVIAPGAPAATGTLRLQARTLRLRGEVGQRGAALPEQRPVPGHAQAHGREAHLCDRDLQPESQPARSQAVDRPPRMPLESQRAADQHVEHRPEDVRGDRPGEAMTRRALLTLLLVLALPVPAHAGTAYVTVGSFRTIAIDTASGRRGAPIDGGGSMVVTPDNKTVYILDWKGLRPLDIASNTLGAAIPLPAGSSSIAITPDGGTLLVANAPREHRDADRDRDEPARHADRCQRRGGPRDRAGRPDRVRRDPRQHAHPDRSHDEHGAGPDRAGACGRGDRHHTGRDPRGAQRVRGQSGLRAGRGSGERRRRDARAGRRRSDGRRHRDRAGRPHRLRRRRRDPRPRPRSAPSRSSTPACTRSSIATPDRRPEAGSPPHTAAASPSWPSAPTAATSTRSSRARSEDFARSGS